MLNFYVNWLHVTSLTRFSQARKLAILTMTKFAFSSVCSFLLYLYHKILANVNCRVCGKKPLWFYIPFYDRSSRITYREKPDWVVTDFGKIYVRHPRCLHEPTCEPLSPIDKSTNMSANKMAGTEQEDV